MAILVNPNPQQHYVVGIDFGHGETSAAICNLQWNVSAGRSDLDTTDIRINDKTFGVWSFCNHTNSNGFNFSCFKLVMVSLFFLSLYDLQQV